MYTVRNYKDWKKLPWKNKLEYFVLMAVIFLCVSAVPLIYIRFFRSNVECNVAQVSETKNSNQGGTVLGELTKSEEEGFDESKWEFDEKYIEKEKDEAGNYTGYYCARLSDRADARGDSKGEIWLKDKVPIIFSFDLRYELKNKSGNNKASLIFICGTKKEFRLFFPDSDFRFIGFENDKGKRLSRAVNTKEAMGLKMNVGNYPPDSDQINFEINYTYIPIKEEGEEEIFSITDNRIFSKPSPWTQPGKPGAEQKIGFGIFNGTCFKPTYFH